ncbi:endonuclease domain-containing protein [Streptomyces sp. bgisy153]|uniref:endonuclease domain-containing protein n=1 Tax=Streptomyces sp. bgisy153 TaxID=3413793 RepID=UPI003D750894
MAGRRGTTVPTCRDPGCEEEGVIAGRCPGHAIQQYRRETTRKPNRYTTPSSCRSATAQRPSAARETALRGQGGVCAVCAGPRLHSRSARASLCVRCSAGIGRFGEDPYRLRAAAAYVEQWRSRPPRAIPAPPRGRRDKRWYAYKVSPDGYAALLAAQGGGCALCARPPGRRALAVDHDHACCPRKGSRGTTCGRCVRGLLCATCNVGVGVFGDDPARIRKAAAYLDGAVTSDVLAQ